MNYIEKMVCPNGCNARFIATAHVTQDWYVDEHGNYLDTAEECVETTHSPDFYDVWRCEKCDADATLMREPDASAFECRINLNFDGLLPSFYEGILGPIPDGYMIDSRKVLASKPDYDRILSRLTRNLKKRAVKLGICMSDSDAATEAAMAMVCAAPNTAADVKEGVIRFLDGFIIKNEDATPSDEKALLAYMGLQLDREQLMSKEDLIAYLNENGMSDRGIGGLRELQYAQYNKEIIWRYPLCDGNALGGYIFPVKEGFLWIPYDEVESDRGELLVMEDAELLGADGLKSLREDFASYSADLCSALKEAEKIVVSSITETVD